MFRSRSAASPEASADEDRDAPPRLLASLRQLAATSLGIFQTRMALAGIELEEEIQRLLGVLLMALGMLIFIALGLLVFTLMIVLAFRDENRFLAMGILTLVYLGLGAGFGLRIRSILSGRPPIFEATLAELEKDRLALRGTVGHEHEASEVGS